ncbi:MAG: citrate/2-methylcitrate synthase [Chloroflexota bacterium]
MSVDTEQVVSGLRGVLACESSITFLDGVESTLEYRGYSIHDIAEAVSFEEIIHLMYEGRLPKASELASYSARLVELRTVPQPVLDVLRSLPKDANPMAGLRTAVSALAAFDPQSEEMTPEANRAKAMRLAAQVPSVVAAMHRIASGQPVLAPDPGLGHAANYIYMLTGERPEAAKVRALDTALNLYAEHELNASTFTVRVVVGTLSDLYSAIVAGIGALKGPLHGGAIDESMRTILQVGSLENVRPYVDAALAERRIIMGFGHGVYRTSDARAPHLRKMCETLAKASGDTKWSDIALAFEAYVKERKGLFANVDFFAAPVLYYLGFPLSLFTNFVASSRVVGWCAHALEQYERNRLIRPRTKYVGDRERTFVPLASR